MPKRSFSARIAHLIALFTAFVLTFAVTQGAAIATTQSAAPRPVVAALPTQGMFDSCALDTDLSGCEQDLQVMSAAGLKVVVQSTWGVSEQGMQAYATYAQSVGIGVMWQLNDPGFWGGAWLGSSAANDYSEFATGCACTSTTAVLDSIITFLAGLPGTYGYYAADDESIAPGSTPGLTSYVSEIKSVDPNHMVMIGASGSEGQANASAGAVVGNEIYPESTTDIASQADNPGIWDAVQQQITRAQATATVYRQSSAFILQAFSFGDSLSDGEAVGVCTAEMTQSQCASKLLYPSGQVQEELRNEVLDHSRASLILWFNYQETFGAANGASFSSAIDAAIPTVQAKVADAKHSGTIKQAGSKKGTGRSGPARTTKQAAKHERSPNRGPGRTKRTRKPDRKRTGSRKHKTFRWYGAAS